VVLEGEVKSGHSLTWTSRRKRSDLLSSEFGDLIGEVVMRSFFAVKFEDALVDLLDCPGEPCINASLDGGHFVLDSLDVFLSGDPGGLFVSSAVDEDEAGSDGSLSVCDGVWDLTDEVAFPCVLGLVEATLFLFLHREEGRFTRRRLFL